MQQRVEGTACVKGYAQGLLTDCTAAQEFCAVILPCVQPDQPWIVRTPGPKTVGQASQHTGKIGGLLTDPSMGTLIITSLSPFFLGALLSK